MSNFSETKQLTAYIAHLRQPRLEHINLRDELTARGFPCVLSNDLNSGKEFPACPIPQAMEVAEKRLTTLTIIENRFFIYFIDDVSEQGLIELGIAIGVSCEHIAIIGPRRKLTGHFLPEHVLRHYDSVENFIERHFFA